MRNYLLELDELQRQLDRKRREERRLFTRHNEQVQEIERLKRQECLLQNTLKERKEFYFNQIQEKKNRTQRAILDVQREFSHESSRYHNRTQTIQREGESGERERASVERDCLSAKANVRKLEGELEYIENQYRSVRNEEDYLQNALGTDGCCFYTDWDNCGHKETYYNTKNVRMGLERQVIAKRNVLAEAKRSLNEKEQTVQGCDHQLSELDGQRWRVGDQFQVKISSSNNKINQLQAAFGEQSNDTDCFHSYGWRTVGELKALDTRLKATSKALKLAIEEESQSAQALRSKKESIINVELKVARILELLEKQQKKQTDAYLKQLARAELIAESSTMQVGQDNLRVSDGMLEQLARAELAAESASADQTLSDETLRHMAQLELAEVSLDQRSTPQQSSGLSGSLFSTALEYVGDKIAGQAIARVATGLVAKVFGAGVSTLFQVESLGNDLPEHMGREYEELGEEQTEAYERRRDCR